MKKILWIIGQPDSGKSTLAREIKKYIPSIIMDDSYRKNFKYAWNSFEGLMLQASSARAICGEGFNVISVAGAPYENWRVKINQYFKTIIFKKHPLPEVYWVYLTRTKAKIRVKDYEAPINAIHINNDEVRVEESCRIIIKKVWGVDV